MATGHRKTAEEEWCSGFKSLNLETKGQNYQSACHISCKGLKLQAMIQWMDFIGNISECRSYTNRLMLKMEADMFFIFLT